MPLYSIKHFWINRRTAGKVNPEVFFIAHPFQHQEGIGQRHQRDMMMPPLPRTAFKMIQSHFPFHLLVILFNTEASFRLSDQPSKRSPMRRQAGKPVLPGFFVSSGHSINNSCGGSFIVFPCTNPLAIQTITRANRDERGPLVPSLQVIFFQLPEGSSLAI